MWLALGSLCLDQSCLERLGWPFGGSLTSEYNEGQSWVVRCGLEGGAWIWRPFYERFSLNGRAEAGFVDYG